MTLKRNQRKLMWELLGDTRVLKRIELPLLPGYLNIANLLPANIDAPDWGTPDTTETAEFEQFLNDHFPRKKFSEFRKKVDGPNLMEMKARKQGEQINFTLNSKLSNYRFIVETCRMWRAAARIGNMIGRMVGEKPPLRICHCGALFFAQRNNNTHHDKACGSKFRMAKARERKKLKEYEYNRKLKGRPDAKRKEKKVATRRPKAA
jgi:hypothetical protein